MSTLARRLYHVEGRLLHAGNTDDAAAVKEAYQALETERQAKDKALIKAVYDWWADRLPEGSGDAELMKALWRHSGDVKEPCPECDGECGEPCAPITAEAACRALDTFSEQWRTNRGIAQILTRGV